jgi:hypothetical protein
MQNKEFYDDIVDDWDKLRLYLYSAVEVLEDLIREADWDKCKAVKAEIEARATDSLIYSKVMALEKVLREGE